MRWAPILIALLGCKGEPPQPDHSEAIARLRVQSDACWWEFERTQTPLNWHEVPEYVALRPTVLELAALDDPDVLSTVGNVASLCGDLETLAGLARRSPKTPTETRKACVASSEFFSQYGYACSAAMSLQLFCCNRSECQDREGCEHFCSWGCDEGAYAIPAPSPWTEAPGPGSP